MMIKKSDKIYIAGHRGMVGSACWRSLEALGFNNLIGRTSKELDLRDQNAVSHFIQTERPDAIIDAAAKVGGILANDTFPYEFLMDNMLIQNNLIRSAHENNVQKFIFLGSSCIYPKFALQPIKEDYLLTGLLEPTNEWYAIAKISGLKIIESLRKEFGRNYVTLMPTNLYGENDNFDLESSHVLPAMIRKFHDAKYFNSKNVELWGSGRPFREFLHVDDLASAVVFSLQNDLQEPYYNVGSGYDLSIKELSEKVQSIVGFQGDVYWNDTMPDGTPKKLLNSEKLRSLGWRPKIDLDSGIINTYKWYLKSLNLD
jgi:GDP-L-fucose synthase